MRKMMKICGLILLATFVIVGFWVTKPPKTLDFRGIVHEITQEKTKPFIQLNCFMTLIRLHIR